MIVRFRRVGAWLAGAAVLGACDAPTDPGGSAVATAPSMLITPACAGTGGQTHTGDTIRTAQIWTRANSPHRVMGWTYVDAGGKLTIAPGAAVCFEPYVGLVAQNGGRVMARGRDTAKIVFTGRDPARGWRGIRLSGAPAAASYLTNIRIEHVNVDYVAVTTSGQHAAVVDSAVIRQSGRGVSFSAPGSRLIRSAVDSTTNRYGVAVLLAAGSFEGSVVRHAAGDGVQVTGPNVLLLGGRIEGSTDVGLTVETVPLNRYSRAVRVVGGQSYPARLSLSAFVRLYSTPALQDSLLGNARETAIVYGGWLHSTLAVGPRLPLWIDGYVVADSLAAVVLQPGARIYFARYAGLAVQNGGRLISRGSATSPVLLTAENPAVGWRGLLFTSNVPLTSYVTNTRVEHTGPRHGGLTAYGNHRVIVDSAVFRHTGFAVNLLSYNSRLMRTLVDTTLNRDFPAVGLAGNTRMESTRIRASAGHGVEISGPGVVVASCDIRDGERDGIVMHYSVAVRNCNLVNNLGVGIRNWSSSASATGNWWGSTGGPNGVDGDGAAGPLVVSPWRTTPYTLPYVP
ncbi:MAG TPA: right-handed parallel beta-helix repeat-containing protein [Longimicrobium sp.]|nr:right-handed parallel beta-helix repeat-containing protein [Longimicrobium sp.]